jgi:quercetin 2,3-dioxygenase
VDILGFIFVEVDSSLSIIFFFSGFGRHPHRDAEIMTYVVHGSLVHEDSMGNKGEVKRGGIQYMSAGSGVQHSEHNVGDTPLRFIQCWYLLTFHFSYLTLIFV